jgi:hypothetical protein
MMHFKVCSTARSSPGLRPAQLPRSITGLAILSLLATASGTIAGSAAWARPLRNDTSHFLVAQQVVDGLPPPPPGSSFAQQDITQYLVVVNGDSQTLLSQVQQLQPSASVQEYNGQRFIQAGLFYDATIAQQQVANLSASGIGAQVVPVVSGGTAVSQAPMESYGSSADMNMLPPPEILPTTMMPDSSREVEFGSAPGSAPSPEVAGSGRAYFVVIPGGGQDVDTISTQITRLTDGMGIDGMVQPASSRGSHVRVGPFKSRSAANRWTRYFRDFGMDARVSYGR